MRGGRRSRRLPASRIPLGLFMFDNPHHPIKEDALGFLIHAFDHLQIVVGRSAIGLNIMAEQKAKQKGERDRHKGDHKQTPGQSSPDFALNGGCRIRDEQFLE